MVRSAHFLLLCEKKFCETKRPKNNKNKNTKRHSKLTTEMLICSCMKNFAKNKNKKHLGEEKLLTLITVHHISLVLASTDQNPYILLAQ